MEPCAWCGLPREAGRPRLGRTRVAEAKQAAPRAEEEAAERAAAATATATATEALEGAAGGLSQPGTRVRRDPSMHREQ